MDFHLDDDQLALQHNVGRFCRSRWSLERIGERRADALDRAAWSALVDLGVISAMVPEADGGLGLGFVEGAVVFEQLGRHLVPGPLLWSALAARVIPEVARGDWIAAGTEDDGPSPRFVEYGTEVDTLLVLRPDGASRIDRERIPPGATGDALDPQSRVAVFSSLPAGTPVGDAAAAATLRHVGRLLAAALQLGIADAALEVAVAYSLERRQFGVPIGSFQALKHIMADMYVRVGLARSATYAAAAVLDDPAFGNADRCIRAAKLLAGEAAVENARASIQILGGMGFTWEMAPHFLLKRALVLDQSFGTPAAHALAVGAALADEVGGAQAGVVG
jgi:alkylation response protein AidB-like acyl-CoA dehydrogenase